jgi:PKD repeat protein
MNTFRLALLTMLMIGIPSVSYAGTISKVTASPASVVTGQPVTFAAEGTNPCGAANLNYGDGTEITYAITGLPVQQTHAFEKPGTYTVTARGMGNCDGETTTIVQVKPAPAPPPAPAPAGPHVTSLQFTPAQGVVRQPVMIIVNGEGTCRFSVDFGDGNSREFNAELPHHFEHTYALPEAYTVIVAPAAPCSGKFTERLTITEKTAAPRLIDMTIEPSPSRENVPVTITVKGSGACIYAIDFGDGNNDSRTATLPERVEHNYPAAGDYIVNVTAIPPCTGSARSVLHVRERWR